MKDVEVTELFGRCHHHVDPVAYQQDILAAVVDVTDQVERPQHGYVIAADGSNYEASVSDGFPSARNRHAFTDRS